MKKQLFAGLIAAALLGTLSLSAAAADSTAPKATIKPEIDGVIDPVWSVADRQYGTIYGDTNLINEKIVNSYTSVMWDESGLYILGVAYDSTPVVTEGNSDNGVDFWISETFSNTDTFDSEPGDYSFCVNSIGDASYYNGNEHVYEEGVATIACQSYDAEGYYVIEIYCPWQTPGFAPQIGTIMGYDVSFNDDIDLDGVRDMYSYWGVADGYVAYWSETQALLQLEFVDGPAVETPAEEEAPAAVEADAPAAPASSAPVTADAGVLAAAAVMALAAGAVLSKKNR